jgi:hypothetical protein
MAGVDRVLVDDVTTAGDVGQTLVQRARALAPALRQ